MARKSSRSDQPQSNTVLIVFLVLSILIALTLGVFLYLAQDKITQAEEGKKKEETTRKSTENQLAAATNVYIPLLRKIIGDETVGADQLAAIKEKFADAERDLKQAWHNGNAMKQLLGSPQSPGLIGPATDQAIGLPKMTLMDKVREVNSQMAESLKKLKDTETKLANLTSEFETYKKQNNPDETTRKLKLAQDAFELEKRNLLKQKDDVITDLNKRIQDITNDVQKQFTDATTEFKKKVADVQAAADAQVKSVFLERAEEKKKQQIDRITSLNVPKARIVKVDSNTDSAYIDIGSDVKLPLQLTFAVHGPDIAGNASPRPKAEVEVINIVGPQLAQVRIKRVARPDAERNNLNPETSEYWIADPRQFVRSNNPVIKGDYLYNTVWDPNRQMHIALAGEFDLDGDGTDDIQALINLLRAQGAEIDMYLDKANGYQPRGKLEFGTDMLIIGGVNPLTSRTVADGLANKGTDLIKNAEKLQKDAIEKGIEIVTLPRFLNRIGFSTPRALIPRAAGVGAASEQPAGEEKSQPKN